MYVATGHRALAEQLGEERSLVRARGAVRRAANVLLAVLALVLSLPAWLLIAAAIKLSSPGPVFYSQVRVGIDRRDATRGSNDARRRHDLGGRPFHIYKFRTMATDAERTTGAVWAGADDPRVTPVGRFLRRLHLDELPQLINVLKADMNIVGPRPERPAIFAALAGRIPGYASRQRVLPGITGYAQVHLDYDRTVDDVAAKLEYDLAYIRAQSLAADLRIMARTVPVLFFRDRLLRHASTAARPTARKE